MGTGASANDEWIELFNSGNASADLSGWMLKGGNGSPNIALSGSLAAGGYYLLERTDDTTVNDILASLPPYTGALPNTCESLTLTNSSGQIADQIGCNSDGTWYAGDNATKASMERKNPSLAGNDPTNWATNDGSVMVGSDASGGRIHGTPGYRNSVFVG